MNPKRDSCGFTLIEVLVALAVIAITLGAALKISGSQINHAQRQLDSFRAQLCAQNELVKLRLTRQFPPTGDQSFTCEQVDEILKGNIHIEPTPNPSFRRVDVLVYQKVPRSVENAPILLRLSGLVGRY